VTQAGRPNYMGSITELALKNVDRNNWGCATSRAFREVACGAEDTFPASVLELAKWFRSKTHLTQLLN